MSTSPIKHHQRTRAVLASNLPPLQRLLLIAISDHLTDGNDYCWPSFARLAAMTGMSRRHVGRLVNVMVDAELLHAEKRTGLATRYMIDWDLLSSYAPNQGHHVTSDTTSPVTPRHQGHEVTRDTTSPDQGHHVTGPGTPCPTKKGKKKEKERGSTTTTSMGVPTAQDAPPSTEPPIAPPKPSATPAAVVSSPKADPGLAPQRAEDRPTAAIPVVGPRLVALGIETLGELAAFSRDALYTLTVDSSSPFRSGELDLIAAALRRADLLQAVSGRPQAANDVSSGAHLRLVAPKPWEDKPVVPIRLKKFDFDRALENWISLREYQLNNLREDIREAGGGWPELRIWLTYRVEDPDAVIAYLKQQTQTEAA